MRFISSQPFKRHFTYQPVPCHYYIPWQAPCRSASVNLLISVLLKFAMVMTNLELGELAITCNSFKLKLRIPAAKTIISGSAACTAIAAAVVADRLLDKPSVITTATRGIPSSAGRAPMKPLDSRRLRASAVSVPPPVYGTLLIALSKSAWLSWAVRPNMSDALLAKRITATCPAFGPISSALTMSDTKLRTFWKLKRPTLPDASRINTRSMAARLQSEGRRRNIQSQSCYLTWLNKNTTKKLIYVCLNLCGTMVYFDSG